MDEPGEILVYKDDPDFLAKHMRCLASLRIPPLDVQKISVITVEDAETPPSSPRDELTELLSDEEFQKCSLSPRLNDYLASDQTTLDLAKCFLGSLKKYNVRWLAKLLILFPALTSVILKANNLNGVPIEVFTGVIIALRSVKHLTDLTVSCNNIAADAWRWSKWCKGVFSNQQLLRLNLANNKFYNCYEPHWLKLGKAFAYSKNLTSVNLANNGLGALEGQRLRNFLQCLKRLPPKCSIDLSWNDLGALESSDWFIFLNFARKFYGHLILDHNNLSERRQAELNNIYHQRTFIGKTGGTLRSLVCQMIWRTPELFDYNEDQKTLNGVELPDDVDRLLQSQSACRRC